MGEPLDRRAFLRMSGVSAGTLLALGAAPGFLRPARSEPLDPPFAHGVASGDPLPDRVVLWTRVTPEPQATPGSGRGRRASVRWLVAEDPQLRHVVRQGLASTGPERDHTIKVDVDGLEPGRAYHYAFELGGRRSPVGITRTAPAAGSAPADLRFALVSCSNFEGGYFAGYRGIAERDDLDFVLHVGDYIYEYRVGYYGAGPQIGREHRPETDVVTLEEYRQRYACYREDPDLRAVHAAHPFIMMWDDHEVADDNWAEGAYNHDEDTQGPYEERLAAATQAYLEWLPIREHADDPARLYRRFELGSLATLHMIDSRSYRSRQVGADELDPGAVDPRPDPAVDDPDRTMLGREQKEWFKAGLAESQATWQLVGNPQMITPVLFPPLPRDLTGQISDVTGLLPRDGAGYNKDQWDGYRAAREEILRHLADNGIDNTVFFTGDIHSSWACDVPIDPGGYPLVSPSVATELVGTSVTSDNLDEITGSPPRTTSVGVEEAFKLNNRHIKMIEFDSHGYSIVDVNAERIQMDWWYLRSQDSPQRPQHDPHAEPVHDRSWRVEAGTNRVAPADGPVGERLRDPDAVSWIGATLGW
jgi:alkaline phosphatase D